VCMMKPQSQRHTVLLGMLSCKSLLHEVEERQARQLGTTICDGALKGWDKIQAASESAKDEYK